VPHPQAADHQSAADPFCRGIPFDSFLNQDFSSPRDARVISVRPSMIGYAIFIQYDGITNMEEFRYKMLPLAEQEKAWEWQRLQYPKAA
jgi:hypothetical protein